MKKVLFVGMVFGALALTSCKKEYTCDFADGQSQTYSEKDFTDAQISAAKTGCNISGGTWSEN
jgi:hypothetical protein